MELPDDMYLGFLLGMSIIIRSKTVNFKLILETVYKIPLTNVSTFNHHLDESQFQDIYTIPNQV